MCLLFGFEFDHDFRSKENRKKIFLLSFYLKDLNFYVGNLVPRFSMSLQPTTNVWLRLFTSHLLSFGLSKVKGSSFTSNLCPSTTLTKGFTLKMVLVSQDIFLISL